MAGGEGLSGGSAAISTNTIFKSENLKAAAHASSFLCTVPPTSSTTVVSNLLPSFTVLALR
jgi:hypothetical protein